MKTIIDDMVPQLVLHEGLKLKPYKDTRGNWTVLVGYNLTARGWDFIEQTLGRAVRPTGVTAALPFGDTTFTREDALAVLRADLVRFTQAVPVYYTDYHSLDDVRKRVVLDMAFNMGFKALGFKNCIAAVHVRDWSRATREMYTSDWAHQVGDGPGGKRDRCDRLAQMLLTGQIPTDIPGV